MVIDSHTYWKNCKFGLRLAVLGSVSHSFKKQFLWESCNKAWEKLLSRPFLNYIYLLAMFIIPNHVLFFVCVSFLTQYYSIRELFAQLNREMLMCMMLNTVCGAIQDINYTNTITISIFTI